MSRRYSRRDLFSLFGRRVRHVTAPSRAPLRGLPTLRPPGFDAAANTGPCVGCTACVEACPRDAIFKDGEQRPGIDPDTAPCVLCDDLPCIPACPAEVLLPVARTEVRMAVAVVDEGRCRHAAGIPCTDCHTACPLPGTAMVLGKSKAGPRPIVVPEACTGCGSCLFACPERPRAIVMQPATRPPPTA